MNLRNKYSWLDYQVKATTVSEYIDALKDENVDNVVFVGQDASTMPAFYYENGSWHIDSEGATAQQRELAQTIAAEGLEMAYAMKSPIERTTENAAYVSNRDAGSRTMWNAIAEEKQEAKASTGKTIESVQYSVGPLDDVLTDRELARFYSAVGEMRIGKKKQFVQNQTGQYMVAIDDKIIYTDGKWKNPSIDRVDTILLADETEVDFVRQIIIQNERGQLSDEQAGNLVREAFGDELVWRRDGNSAGTFVWENSRGEGNVTGTDYSETGDGTRQYSVRFEESDQWGMLIEFARDKNNADLIDVINKGLGGKLTALLKPKNTSMSFQQANPIRIMKTLAASLGTQLYTADIKDRAVHGYSDVHAQNIVVDSKSAADPNLLLGMTSDVVYSKIEPHLEGMDIDQFIGWFTEYMTSRDEQLNPIFATELNKALESSGMDNHRQQCARGIAGL